MTDYIQILAEHAARTLPDSLADRQRVLRAIVHGMTENHPAMRNVWSQLALLECIDALQEQLPQKLPTT